jgi:hypothetical protein
MCRLLVAALVLFASSSNADAQSSAETFLGELQTALRNGDRTAVAARIQYPITVRIGGLRVPFDDAADLLERYDDIFTPALRAAIARAGAPIATGDGFLIARDALVVRMIDQQLRITAIAVPPPDPSDAPVASPPEKPTASARRTQAPIRVGIRGGPRPTQFMGSLLPGATDVYLLWVPKERLLEVRLERVPGRAALIRVVHAVTGASLNPRTTGGARVVTGMARDSADYRIEVRRAEAGDAAPLPYMVSLSLK